MRSVIFIIGVLVLSGCGNEPYRDPYLAAVRGYVERLDNRSDWQNDSVPSPPEPQYLRCGTELEPLPGIEGTGARFGRLTTTEAASPRRISTVTRSRCEQINSDRKQAYDAALVRYEEVLLANRKVSTEGF